MLAHSISPDHGAGEMVSRTNLWTDLNKIMPVAHLSPTITNITTETSSFNNLKNAKINGLERKQHVTLATIERGAPLFFRDFSIRELKTSPKIPLGQKSRLLPE